VMNSSRTQLLAACKASVGGEGPEHEQSRSVAGAGAVAHSQKSGTSRRVMSLTFFFLSLSFFFLCLCFFFLSFSFFCNTANATPPVRATRTFIVSPLALHQPWRPQHIHRGAFFAG